MRSIIVWSLLLIGWISPSNLLSQTIDESLDLAKELISKGLNDESIPVLERVIFFSPGQHIGEASFLLAQSYLATKDYEKALSYLDQAYLLYNDEAMKRDITYLKSVLYLETQNPSFALLELLSIPESDFVDQNLRKHYYLGATYIKLEQYYDAQKEFEKYLHLSGREDYKDSLAILFKDTAKIKRYNPLLPAYASLIIPGSGQLFVGGYKEALNSFLLVGSLEFAFIYVGIKYSLLDAYLSIFPWWQRYYMGGYKVTKKLAIEHEQKMKDGFYTKVLKEVYINNTKSAEK